MRWTSGDQVVPYMTWRRGASMGEIGIGVGVNVWGMG